MQALHRFGTALSVRLSAAFLFGSLLAVTACSPARVGVEIDDMGVPQDLTVRPPRPDFAPPPVYDFALPDVHVVITADNAYAFGFGFADRVTKLNGRPKTVVAGDIFNCPIGVGPEAYDIPAAEAPESSYLYIVAWADDAVTEGVLGQFERSGTPLYTGDANWQVCATGQFYDPGPAGGGPTLDVVNQELARCNTAAGSPATSSAGWVSTTGAVTPGAIGNLAVGEDNSSPDGDFPIVCQKDAMGQRGIDSGARWMWYSPDGKSPFRYTGGKNPTRTFLIFRLPSRVVVIG